MDAIRRLTVASLLVSVASIPYWFSDAVVSHRTSQVPSIPINDALSRAISSNWKLWPIDRIVGKACATDIKKLCPFTLDRDICLKEYYDSLSDCCQLIVLSGQEDMLVNERYSAVSRVDSPHIFLGVKIPLGTTYSHKNGYPDESDSYCSNLEFRFQQPTKVKGLTVNSAVFNTSDKGYVSSAVLSGEQNVGGYWIKETNKELEFHENGLPKSAHLSRLSTANGYSWMPGEKAIRIDSDGAVKSGLLAKPAHFDGFLLAPGYTELSSDRKIIKATLAKSAKIDGWDIPSGSRVTYSYDGGALDSVVSPTEFTFDNLHIKADSELQLLRNGSSLTAVIGRNSRVANRFYPSGTRVWKDIGGEVTSDDYFPELERKSIENGRLHLKTIKRVLKEASYRAGVLLPAGSMLLTDGYHVLKEVRPSRAFSHKGIMLAKEPLVFYQNGDSEPVWMATLQMDQKINKFPASAAHKVEFHNNGTIANITLTEDVEIKIGQETEYYLATAVHELRFHSTGAIAEFTPKENVEIDGVSYQRGRRIGINEEEVVTFGILSMSQIIGDLSLPANSAVSYDSNGILRRVRSRQSINVDSLSFSGIDIKLTSEGRLEEGLLNKPAVIAGKQYAAGTQLYMSTQGKVLESHFYGLSFNRPLHPLAEIYKQKQRNTNEVKPTEAELNRLKMARKVRVL